MNRQNPHEVSLASLLKTQEHKEQYKQAPTHPSHPSWGLQQNPAAATGHRVGPHVTTGQDTQSWKTTSPYAPYLLGRLTDHR